MISKFFLKCPKCNVSHFISFYKHAQFVCSRCGFHARLDAHTRIKQLCDRGTFQEIDIALKSTDPLNFPKYRSKLAESIETTKLKEAVVTGLCKINGCRAAIAVLEPNFIMASMGSVVGEKITRMLERATKNRLPAVMVISSGGARMQEGILSLMQMAKTAAAVRRLHDRGMPLINVLSDPTTGGVTASFGMLGDVLIAETAALIGFAGPRVIQQTIGQVLPQGFQTAEFLLDHGMLDLVVHRRHLKSVIGTLLKLHQIRPYPGREKSDAL
jgi:acetyl-CoA carboxylase carboxyl transferase subunit beta